MTERESSNLSFDKVNTTFDGGRECKNCGRSIREKEVKCPNCGSTNFKKEEP